MVQIFMTREGSFNNQDRISEICARVTCEMLVEEPGRLAHA